ncbi:YtzH-like family protein [Alkalihalobacillus oceani]|uniref:YtzH-like family protein n=1 Tax=Halalkalibacter oceani TaxID=1653776 RepID=UPI00203A9005|nr:YtzH-like family protein [Halalkalibacter oceani]MCM3759586.1 YtzH-like family protein [Halalkalibacter oceani]
MPLSSANKIQLLKDILQNQATEQHMTIDEADQIEQLLTHLSVDASLQPGVQQTLQQIQQLHVKNTEPFQQNDVEQWLTNLSIE